MRNPLNDPTVAAFEEFVARSGRAVALAALGRSA
jgi:hypothetical protein